MREALLRQTRHIVAVISPDGETRENLNLSSHHVGFFSDQSKLSL
jgi:hypothetical protein